jgi:hypothetical protein
MQIATPTIGHRTRLRKQPQAAAELSVDTAADFDQQEAAMNIVPRKERSLTGA